MKAVQLNTVLNVEEQDTEEGSKRNQCGRRGQRWIGRPDLQRICTRNVGQGNIKWCMRVRPFRFQQGGWELRQVRSMDPRSTDSEFDWNDNWNDGMEFNVMGRAPWEEPWTTVGSSGSRWPSGGPSPLATSMAKSINNVNRYGALRNEEDDTCHYQENNPTGQEAE